MCLRLGWRFCHSFLYSGPVTGEVWRKQLKRAIQPKFSLKCYQKTFVQNLVSSLHQKMQPIIVYRVCILIRKLFCCNP